MKLWHELTGHLALGRTPDALHNEPCEYFCASCYVLFSVIRVITRGELRTFSN